MSREKNYKIFKCSAIAATLIIGIICEAFGINMLYQGTTATIGTVSFSAAPILLITGLLLIVAGLASFSKSISGQNTKGLWWNRIWPVLLVIVVLGTFIGTHYKPPLADKYKILLDLILIVLGLTAAVGYGIYRWILQNIKYKMDKIAVEDRNIIRVHTHTAAGYVWFQYYFIETEKNQEMNQLRAELKKMQEYLYEKKEQHKIIEIVKYASEISLDHAIDSTRRAIEYAKKLKEKEDEVQEEAICICKNNLAYYLAERQRLRSLKKMEIDLLDKKEAHESAEYAYRVAQSDRALRYRDPSEWEDTYAWVLWHFAGADKEAIRRAREIVDELKSRTTIPFERRHKLEESYNEL